MIFPMLFGFFPLEERANVYSNKWQAWIPAVSLSIIFVLLITASLFIRLRKITKKIKPLIKKNTLADIKTNAINQINKLLEDLLANRISESEAAEGLSHACRFFIDQIYDTKAIYMTLSEIKRKKMTVWINRIVEYCYSYEFSDKKIHNKEHLVAFIESKIKDIESWH